MPAMTQSQVNSAYNYLTKLYAKTVGRENPKITIRDKKKDTTRAER